MNHILPVQHIEDITRDVVRITLPKPDGYSFTPGQATEVALNKEGWKEEERPFTFTSLPEDDHLEFTIKIYDDHDGVTAQIGTLTKNDELQIGDAWGAIEYKGPGVFIAGGAGVTPFISVLRDLRKKEELEGNKLIFSNKTEKDIILEDEFRSMLGDDFINVITDEKPRGEHHFLDGHMDRSFLQDQINDLQQSFYVCGPPDFNDAMLGYLKELGAKPDALIFEK